jgi:hypothetical protein
VPTRSTQLSWCVPHLLPLFYAWTEHAACPTQAELRRPGVVAEAVVFSDDEIEDDDMLDLESSRHASPTQSESDTGVYDSGSGTSGGCVEPLTDQDGGPISTVTSSRTTLDILPLRLSSDRADQRIKFDYEPKSGYHYVDSIGLERPASFPIRPPLPPPGSTVDSLRLKRILGLDLQQQSATAQEAGRDAYHWLEVRVQSKAPASTESNAPTLEHG